MNLRSFLSALRGQRGKNSARLAAPSRPRLSVPKYRALEARIAFDAAAVATAANAADHQASQDHAPDADAQKIAPQMADAHALANALTPAAPDQPALFDMSAYTPAAGAPHTPVEIVFIDSSVANRDTLLAGINPNAEVVILDSSKDGVEQIAATLAGRTGIDAIHIVSHGTAGQLILGNGLLNAQTIADTYADELSEIKSALSAEADILIYGCDFAAGEDGVYAEALLANATGADIAASVDGTGAADLGGNWDLESKTGAIESRSVFSSEAEAAYRDLLTVTVNNGNGAVIATAGNSIYSVDIATGKATVVATPPTIIGGVDRSTWGGGGSLNAVAINHTNGLVYFTDGTVSANNRALFAYDYLNNAFIVIDDNVTDNGAGASIALGTRLATGGITGGGAAYNDATNTLYLGIENVDGTGTFNGQADQIYAVTFSNNGRTIATAAEFGARIAASNPDFNWGDLSINSTGTELLSFSGNSSTFTRYNLANGAIIANATVTLTAGQLGTDSAGNTYAIAGTTSTTIQTFNQTTGALGTATAVTTDGTTAVTGLSDSAGFVPATGSVSGTIFSDANANGSLNAGEVGAANVTVQLIFDRNNNGVADAGETVLATDTTDATGRYQFNGVLPGQYVVRVNDTNGVLTARTSSTAAVTTVAGPPVNWTRADGDLLTNAGGGAIGRQVTGIDFGYNNVPPVLDLDGATAGSNFTATFKENGAAVAIASATASITDTNDANTRAATITLTNPQAGDRLLVNGSALANGTLASGIAWTRTDTVVTLSGNFTRAQYAAALALVQFTNTSETPSIEPRTINTTVSDGTALSNVAVTTITVDPAPDPVNDAFSGNEDTDISGNFLTNDDLGSTPITSVTVLTGPANGTFTSFNPTTGAFVYTPNPNFNGTDTFTYRVTDSNGDINTATVTLTVNAVNDAPVNALPTSYSTTEDTSVALTGLSVSDADAGLGTITVTLSVPPGNGTITATGAGGVTVTGSGTNALVLTGTLANINTFLGATAPIYNPVTNANGSVTLTMLTNDGGNTGTGGPLQDSDNITINIAAVNDTPTLVVPSSITVTEDVASNINGITFADIDAGILPVIVTLDVPTGRLAATSGSGVTVGGTGSSLTLTGSIANINAFIAANNVTYTTALNANGSVTLTATINDQGNTGLDPGLTGTATDERATASITLNITALNDAPVVVGSPIANRTSIDSELLPASGVGVFSVAGRFADPDTGDVLRYTASGLPPGLTLNPATGVISGTIDHSASVTDPYTVVVTATDTGGLSAAQTFTWVVTNPAPVARDDAFSTTENTAISGSVFAANGNGADGDSDGDTFVVSQVNGAAASVGAGVTGTGGGTFQINSDGSYTFNPGTAFDSLGAGQTRTTSVTYAINDNEGGTSTATVTVTVTGVNDVAVIGGTDTGAVTEDTNVVGGALRSSGTLTVTDVDAGQAVFQVSTQAGTYGSLSITAAGVWTYTASNAQAAIQGLGTGETLSETFTVRAADGATHQITITINGLNDAPVAVDDTASGLEDAAQITGDVTPGTAGQDSDVDGDTITVTQFTVAGVAGTFTAGTTAAIANVGSLTINADGSYTFVPALNYNGTVPVATYTISDGNGGFDTGALTITVTPVNDAPVAVDDVNVGDEDTTISGDLTPGSVGQDSDIDGDTLTVTQFTVQGIATPFAVNATTGGTATIAGVGTLRINANGSYTFTPLPNTNGPVPLVTYTVADGKGGTGTATLTLSVRPVNDAPVAVDARVTTLHDVPIVGTLPVAFDADGDQLLYALGTIVPSHGTVVVNANGTYTYTPTAAYFGDDTFTYTVTDGQATVTKTITVRVMPDNRPPVAVDATAETGRNTPVVSSLPVATDPELDALTYGMGATGPAHGTIVIQPNGSYVYTPSYNFIGTDTFTYTVTDGQLTVEKTITITVNPRNVAPIANDDRVTARDATPITINVLANDSDPDRDPLTVIAVTSSAGFASVNPDGTIRFAPPGGFSGTAVLTYWLADDQGGLTEANVFVTVDEPRIEPYVGPTIEPVAQGGGKGPPVVQVGGAVIDAVHGIGGLASVANGLGVDRVILNAANRIESLGGLQDILNGGFIAGPGVIETARAQQIVQRLLTSGRSFELGAFDPQGITGFSLRFSIGGAGVDESSLGSSHRVEMVFESLVRERTLIVQFSGLVTDPSVRVVEYRAMQADGKPLPDWLSRAGRDLLTGKWPVTQENVDLRVTAVLSNGETITRDVRIQTNTGELQPLEKFRTGESQRLFSDHIACEIERVQPDVRKLVAALRAVALNDVDAGRQASLTPDSVPEVLQNREACKVEPVVTDVLRLAAALGR